MSKNKLANFKRIVYIVLVMLVFSFSLSLVACSKPNDPPSTGSGSGAGETSGTTGETTGESGATNPYSQYSELLQGVLTSDYYNGLIAQAKANPEFYKTASFDPHPYAFLEDQGYDINSIKNGTLTCYTVSFIKDSEPNNLYISTRVENPGDFYTNYLLKYNLTDKELFDYKLAHDKPDTVFEYYIQSVFMNDAVSNTKTPISIEKANITINAYDNMTEEINEANLLNTDFCDIIISNVDVENNSLDLKALPKFTDKETTCYSTKIEIIPCLAQIKMNNNVYIGPSNYGTGGFEDKSRHTEDIKLFTTQNLRLNYMYCHDLKQ